MRNAKTGAAAPPFPFRKVKKIKMRKREREMEINQAKVCRSWQSQGELHNGDDISIQLTFPWHPQKFACVIESDAHKNDGSIFHFQQDASLHVPLFQSFPNFPHHNITTSFSVVGRDLMLSVLLESNFGSFERPLLDGSGPATQSIGLHGNPWTKPRTSFCKAPHHTVARPLIFAVCLCSRSISFLNENALSWFSSPWLRHVCCLVAAGLDPARG